MDVYEWEKGWQLWDLIAFLGESGALISDNIYRGQTDSEWKLVPGLYRQEVNIFGEMSKAELYEVAENQMLNAFFSRAEMILPNYKRGPLMDRFIAQHYGVPTQLLDWTLDPFIALYFATHSGNPEKDCALFYIQPLSSINISNVNFRLPYKGRITKLVPPVMDDRVKSQKSVFTLHNFGGDQTFTPIDERTLKYSKKNEGTHSNDEVHSIGKIVIPAERRQQILFQLLMLGIDSSLVYPGLAGIGQRIADIARIQKYGGGQGY